MDVVTVVDTGAKWSDTKDATSEHIQTYCDQVKTQVEEKTKKRYVEFKAVKYREFIKPGFGGGADYVIKVHAGGESYDHLTVHVNRSIPVARYNLLDVQQHKTKDDPLVPFKA